MLEGKCIYILYLW